MNLTQRIAALGMTPAAYHSKVKTLTRLNLAYLRTK